MPRPDILKALGMTAAEWGTLPPESETINGQVVKNSTRGDLRARAQKIIDEHAAKNPTSNKSLSERITACESRIASIERYMSVRRQPVENEPLKTGEGEAE